MFINLMSWKDNLMTELPELTEEVIANLTDSQKINIQILQNLTSMNTRMNRLGEDVSLHNKILITGNGLPSLQERIRSLEEFVGNMRYWGRFVGGAIILQTIVFLFATVMALVRFLPLLESISKNP